MTDIIKGISGENRFLVMTEQDARQIMSSAPNLNFYRCQQMGEFDAVLDSISAQPKIELCHKLQIGLSTYDSFLIEQFKANILHMYFTGTSHYTASSNKLAETSESIFYLVPAIYGLEYSGVNFFNLTSNPEASKQYVERFKLDEMKPQQLIQEFYSNTGSMYKNGAPMFPLPKHYENHLVELLIGGDAIIIEKSKSLFAPFVEMFSSAVAVGGALQSNKIDDTCQPIEVFIIRCEHYPKARKFQLDVINTAPNFNGNQHVLQVVAQTDKPETVTIEYDKANCTNGDVECPSIVIDSTDGRYSGQVIKTTPYKLVVEPNISKYPENSDGNPVMKLVEFIKDFFIPSKSITNPNIYTVKTQGCDDISGHVAEVHCYPMMQWEGEIIAGRKNESEQKYSLEYDDDNNLSKAALPPNIKTAFTFGGEIALQINNRKFTPVKYSHETEGDSENFILKRIEKSVSGFLDNIALIKKIGDAIGIKSEKFTITPPNIAIGGGMKAVEHPASGVIDYEGSVHLKAKPLIGLDIEIDFLNILIIMAGGATAALGGPIAAKFIIEMREKFSTGVGDDNSVGAIKGDFYAKFIVKGSAEGSLIWTSKPGGNVVIEQGVEDSEDLDEDGNRISYTKGELQGKVGITLEAGAYVEGRLLKISVKAGIGIGVSGSKLITDPVGLFVTLAASSEENKPTLSGNVEFSGLQIYYIKFAEISRKEGVNADKGKVGGQRQRGDERKSDHNLKDAKTLYTVIESKRLWEFGEGETSTPQTLTQV
jgi:hypothetical protein